LKLTINEFYDDEDGKYIATKYYINSEECSEEDYDDMLDQLDEINIGDEVCDEVETYECEIECCADCEYNETGECDCPECTIEKYIERILELGGSDMCPGCLREALTDFMYEVVDHIVVENMNDNENEYIN